MKGGVAARAALNALSGAIPLAGGLLSAAASAWSEKDQAKVNDFLHHLMEMLAAEMHEKHQTIVELTSRIDMQDEKISERVKSPEYQALLRKAFRDWASTEFRPKARVRAQHPVERGADRDRERRCGEAFLEWIGITPSGTSRSSPGSTTMRASRAAACGGRSGGRRFARIPPTPMLFRLIFHDLSTGRIVRQHRQTDGYGN